MGEVTEAMESVTVKAVTGFSAVLERELKE